MCQPDGTIKYQLRSQADSAPIEMLNLLEKEAFMNGDKVRSTMWSSVLFSAFESAPIHCTAGFPYLDGLMGVCLLCTAWLMVLCMYVCTYVCMYVCVYVCVFVDGVHIPASPFASPPTHTHRRLPSFQRQLVQVFLFRLTVGSRWVQIVCAACATLGASSAALSMSCATLGVSCASGLVFIPTYFVLLSHRTRSDGFISLLSCRGVLTRPSNSLVSGRKREERGRE